MELVPLRREFAPQMFAGGQHNDEVNRLTGTHGTFTRAIVEDGRCLGEVVLNPIDDANRKSGLRIALWDGFGKGYGTIAIKHVLDHAFTDRNLHRVDLEVYEFNERAMHVYKKCGFREEGRPRDALLWDGQFYDAIVMSVLSTDNI